MSDILVTGTIMQALPLQQGVSQRGNAWSRQSFIIEHEHGQYPKQMVFDVSNAKIQELNLQVGEEVTIHLNVSLREYPQGSGKFFNSIEAWKADRAQAVASQPQPQAPQQYAQPQYVQQPAPQAPQVQQPMPGQAPFPPQAPQPNGQGQLPF